MARKTTLKVLQLGQAVFVGSKNKRNVEAEITAITIRQNNYVLYEVSWWDDHMNRKTTWLHSKDFSVKGERKTIEIGFDPNKDK